MGGMAQGAVGHLGSGHPGQPFEDFGIVMDACHGFEFGGHWAGADGGDGNAAVFQFQPQTAAEGPHVVLGGAVYRHAGIGYEGGDGGNINHAGTTAHELQGEMGHGRQGANVQIHHAQLPLQIGGGKIAQHPVACVVDKQPHLRPFLLQGGGILLLILFFGNVQGHHPADHSGQHVPQFFQPLPAAGDEPDFFHIRVIFSDALGHFPAQAGGSAGNNRDFHILPPGFLN